MLLSTILTLARHALIEFIDTEFALDSEMASAATDIQRTIILELLATGNAAAPLPGDQTATIDVSALAPAGYTISASPAFWRLRRATLTAGGATRRLTMLGEDRAHQVPPVKPAAYAYSGKLFAIDGDPALAANRLHGWAGATQAVVRWVTAPTTLTAGSETVVIPDEAAGWMAHEIARFEAVRAKLGAEGLAAMDQRLADRKAACVRDFADYGRTA